MLRNYGSRARDEAYERGREVWDTAVERGKDYLESGKETMREAGRTAPRVCGKWKRGGQRGREERSVKRHPDTAANHAVAKEPSKKGRLTLLSKIGRP